MDKSSIDPQEREELQHCHTIEEEQQGTYQAERAHSKRQERVVRRIIPALVLLGALWLLFRSAFVFRHHFCPHKNLRESKGLDIGPVPNSKAELVPLEAHIMSKCPDARDCLQKLVVPSMIEISDKVNFTLSYIGKIDTDSDEVSCMHGPSECLGNIIELCAAHVYPDPRIYLGFTNCMTSSYQDIPERDLVEGCALEHGIDFQKLNNCISDEGEGIDMLRASVQRSQDLNVTKSCTVRLAGEIRCIRDGGKWYDCPGGSNVSDLVQDVKDLYQDLNFKEITYAIA